MTARQGLSVSIKELKALLKDLEFQRKTTKEQLGLEIKDDKKWQISIVNKTPECSDTWCIEE